MIVRDDLNSQMVLKGIQPLMKSEATTGRIVGVCKYCKTAFYIPREFLSGRMLLGVKLR